MKPITLEKFRLTASVARTLAEQNWGTGGTHAYKTNRKGVFYFSCSGHGGYVVNAKALTEQEHQNIEAFVKPDHVSLLVQHLNTGDVVIGVQSPLSVRPRRFRFFPAYGAVEWQDYPFYFFEEDCDWALLEHFTDIRRVSVHQNLEAHEQAIQRTIEAWFLNKKAT